MGIFGDDYDPTKDLLQYTNTLMPVWGSKTQEVTDIPMTSEDPTAITIERLFPLEYSMDPVSGGKFILLQEFNGLLKTLTTQIRNQFMYSGILVYNEKEANDRGGYPLDAVVSILYDEFTGTLCTPESLLELKAIEGISNLERRAKAQRLLVRSLKSDNTDSPLIRDNLFTTWEVMDGVQFGEVKEFMITDTNGGFTTPPGYLDIGSHGTRKYNLSNFPRVELALRFSGGSCGHLKKVDNDYFTITDTRGLFSRVFNNSLIEETKETPRDPGRSFNEIQEDAMGVITGAVTLASAFNYTDDTAYGDATQRFRTLKGFVPVASLPDQLQHSPEYTFLTDVNKQNAFKTLNINTNWEFEQLKSDSEYLNQGIYPATLSNETLKAISCNTLVLDTSDHPKSAHEVRPKNYCVKRYIKV